MTAGQMTWHGYRVSRPIDTNGAVHRWLDAQAAEGPATIQRIAAHPYDLTFLPGADPAEIGTVLQPTQLVQAMLIDFATVERRWMKTGALGEHAFDRASAPTALHRAGFGRIKHDGSGN